MEAVRTRLQNHVDLPAGGASELGRVSVGEHLHLFHRFRSRDDHSDLPIAAALRVVEAVEIPGRALVAAERELRGPESRARKSLHAWREQMEIINVS